MQTRLQEIKFAIASGATEIDVVLDRSLVLMGKWETLYDEVLEMKKACGDAHLKVILGVGELGTYENVSIIYLNQYNYNNYLQLYYMSITIEILKKQDVW